MFNNFSLFPNLSQPSYIVFQLISNQFCKTVVYSIYTLNIEQNKQKEVDLIEMSLNVKTFALSVGVFKIPGSVSFRFCGCSWSQTPN